MPKGPLILCVDDEWNQLEGRKMLLKESGCKVLASTSGEEALQLFACHPVDLVLLGYRMPEMRGDVVAARMKASHAEIPIVLLSAEGRATREHVGMSQRRSRHQSTNVCSPLDNRRF